MNEYRGKHAPSTPWAVASTATVPMRHARHMRRSRRRRVLTVLAVVVLLIMLVYPFIEARILTVDRISLLGCQSSAHRIRQRYSLGILVQRCKPPRTCNKDQLSPAGSGFVRRGLCH